jgi:hypothetical protein
MSINALGGGNSRLGRRLGNSMIQGVRPLLNNAESTGFREVDSNADFIPGMIAKLATVSGKVVVQVHDGVAAVPAVGIFLNTKTTSFYKATSELVGPVTQTVAANLKNPNVKNVRVTDPSNTTTYIPTTDYTVNLVNGTITPVSAAGISNGSTIRVWYSYKDTTVIGFDQTLASGKVALYESDGDYEFLTYDTSATYAVGDKIYVSNVSGSLGLVTNAVLASDIIGYVTKPPTADNVALHVKIQFQNSAP